MRSKSKAVFFILFVCWLGSTLQGQSINKKIYYYDYTSNGFHHFIQGITSSNNFYFLNESSSTLSNLYLYNIPPHAELHVFKDKEYIGKLKPSSEGMVSIPPLWIKDSKVTGFYSSVKLTMKPLVTETLLENQTVSLNADQEFSQTRSKLLKTYKMHFIVFSFLMLIFIILKVVNGDILASILGFCFPIIYVQRNISKAAINSHVSYSGIFLLVVALFFLVFVFILDGISNVALAGLLGQMKYLAITYGFKILALYPLNYVFGLRLPKQYFLLEWFGSLITIFFSLILMIFFIKSPFLYSNTNDYLWITWLFTTLLNVIFVKELYYLSIILNVQRKLFLIAYICALIIFPYIVQLKIVEIF